MSHAMKNSRNVTGSIIGLFVVTAIAVWQFYLFVVSDVNGGTGHLWGAIAAALLACVLAFFVFSIFVRHDDDDDLHITSTRNA